MAIVIENLYSSTYLRKVYNNDILSFYSNDTVNPATSATVSITKAGSASPDVIIKLFPNPQGKFFLNLQSYMAGLINTNQFADTLEPNIGTIDISKYLYDVTIGTVLKATITIQVPFASYSGSLIYFTGVEQIGNSTNINRRDFIVFSPCNELTDNKWNLTYWQGYPFDITLFQGDNIISNTIPFTIVNKTNLQSTSFTVNKAGSVNLVQRLVFSDGRTDETIEDILPLVEGDNKLVWHSGVETSESTKVINIKKQPYKCGVYLKWFNKYGGWNYWLFENTFSIDRNTKLMGELFSDNKNLDKTITRTVQIGKQSVDTVRAIVELLNDEEKLIVEGMLDSPKIYLFTGEPMSRNSYTDWVEVSLKTTNVRVKNAKESLTNFVLDFELPNRYTQTL